MTGLSITEHNSTVDRLPALVPRAGSVADASADSAVDKDSDVNAGSNRAIHPSTIVPVAPPVAPTPASPTNLATTSAPATVPVAPISAPPFSAHVTPRLESAQLTRALDQLKHDVDQHRQRPSWAMDAVFATGVATAAYVALTTRAASWLMTALLSRPLWRQFDPLEILFALEADKPKRGVDGDKEETLQSLVTPTN